MEWIQALDAGVLYWAEAHRTPVLDRVMSFITGLGDAGFIWILLTLALLVPRKTRRAGLAMAAALALSAVLVNLILKPAVMRPRPFDALQGLTAIIPHPADWSFPSGHASASAAAAWAALRRLPKRAGVPAAVLAGLICLSRVYAGVHYPSDVLCGAAVGLACGWLGEKAAERLPEKARRFLHIE